MIINMSDRPMSGHYLTFLMKPLKSSEQISSHSRISTLFSLAVRMLPRCFLSVRKLEVVHKEVGGYLTRRALPRQSLNFQDFHTVFFGSAHIVTLLSLSKEV